MRMNNSTVQVASSLTRCSYFFLSLLLLYFGENAVFPIQCHIYGLQDFKSVKLIILFFTEPTNHSLGLITAMEMIANWSSSLSSSNKSVLLVYVTCGKLNKHTQIHTVLQHMAVMLDIIPTKVLLSAFGLGISRGWYEIFL